MIFERKGGIQGDTKDFWFLVVGTCVPSMKIGSSMPISFDHVEKMVAKDLGAEMARFLFLYHWLRVSRY